ncbi:ABC transporter ATP-binding protein [Leuconostoc lactis]|uniref:ABC transporter ATP-binding protein n=1 Tax=Leuconostoc lactis TaxID=1246 RepID=UPI0006601EDF|nr:ABC transporter ATP-binding protein [Leuconostoc lactis]QEA51259.1 ABC transporter ATP-binding protein [Leuconostoc lactis]GHC17749.1 ABC transporter ATP-binding protein [Leuconostoc lactis KCTC 3528 = DSM 20202]
MTEQILQVTNLSIHYGPIKAVQQVNFVVNRGEIVTLIGANGAGKSTILRGISGLEKPVAGQMLFNSQDLKGLSSETRVRQGIVQVPEGRHVFPGMSVLENLRLGAYTVHNKQQLTTTLAHVFTLFPILAERKNQDAATLSGGEQQMLAIGRALMAQPKIILLDEPSMGLAPLYIQKIFAIIQQIRQTGVTVLVIEQNAHQALRIADRGYVLESGQVMATGTGAELLASSDVRAAYLGG